MIYRKRSLIFFTFFLFSVIALSGVFIQSTPQAQYWASLPPYNILWPLWSPALVTDFNPDPLVLLGTTPIITELSRTTILPVQPVLAWDPCQPLPWPVYNIPLAFGGGLAYFDQTYGLNAWPPPYMLDPVTGAPAPLALPLGFSALLPTSLGHIQYYIPLANLTFALNYNLTTPEFLGLLSAAQLWGLPPL